MTSKYLLTFLCILSVSTIYAQVIWTEPEFPTQSNDVTVYFDASKGNAGLQGFTGDVYAHTGVITNTSNSPSDWKHVQGTWGTTDAPLLTRLGIDLYSISFNIETFYGIQPGEVVEQLAFVFRSADGSIAGRDVDGGDIYTLVYQDSDELLISLTSPSTEGAIIKEDEPLIVSFAINREAQVRITDNGVEEYLNTTDQVDLSLTDRSVGHHDLIISVSDDTDAKEIVLSYLVLEADQVFVDPPEGLDDGLTYTDQDSYIWQLKAPGKEFVFLLCPANEYQPNLDYRMHLSNDQATFWIELPKESFADGRTTYQYLVDGEIRIADPYSEIILDPNNDQWIDESVMQTLPDYPTGMTTDIVTAFDYDNIAYTWSSDMLDKAAKTDLVIYELLLRDFLSDHSYDSLIDTLDYLQDLGVNAIELMPINEFEGNVSWGYNPSFHMAVDKYYGTREQLQLLVDEAHSRGIAVILDVVYNHVFSQSPLARLYWDAANFRPTADNPWLNVTAKHPFNVGYDVNHQSLYTKRWVKQTLAYWIKEFRIDGFRFDLSKGFTQFDSGNNASLMSQYDQSRIDILTDYAEYIWSLDPTNYVILEHFAANSEERTLSERGMMLWGNNQFQFAEAAMGYSSDLDGADYTHRGWDDPHLVAYAESHDEERMMYKLLTFGNDGPDHDTQEKPIAFKRAEAANVIFFSIPGPKMMWQFQELGYDYSINYCEDGSINDDCRLSPKPVRWDYFQIEGRKHIYAVTSAMTHLKTQYPTFATTDFELTDQAYYKRIALNHDDMDALIIANFQVTDMTINPDFQQEGVWYEYFSGDVLTVNDTQTSITLGPGEYRVYTSEQIDLPESYIVETEDLEIVSISGYPNPVHKAQQYIVRLDDSYQIMQIELIDMHGHSYKPNYKMESDQLTIDIDPGYAAGMYILSIRTDHTNMISRVIVK